MRFIVNFMRAIDRLSGLLLRPIILILLLQLVAILFTVNTFDVTYIMPD